MTEPAAPPASPLDRLPAPVRAQLDRLREALEARLGADLVGLLVHGSAARGEYREGRSDVDLIVVLREAGREALEAVANALQLARYAARIEAMVLTEAEIPRAADVFPLLYDDVQRAHVLLAGKDPFADLVILPRHRRLRVEQELREAQIRLRRAVVDAEGSREMLGRAVFRKTRQIRGALRGLLSLRGVEAKDDVASVFAEAGKIYGVDTAPLAAATEDPGRAHAAMEALLAAAVEDVDRMDGEGRAG